MNYVGGTGSLQPDLMIVGEAPGKNEDLQGEPFVGASGEILNSILFKLGLSRSEVYITNVVKYRPPMNDFKKLHLIGVDLADSIKELWENEINRLKPKCILAVGNEALSAITGNTGILNWRGSILLAKDGVTKCVPTIHPAALFNREEDGESKGGLSWTYIKIIESDIARAVEESQTRELILPNPLLTVAHNSLDVFRFFRQYEHLDKAVADIESINCVPVCIGFAFNKHHAISIPLLSKIGNNKITDMGPHELNECWRIVDKELRRLKIVGHNLKYDKFKLSLVGLEMPHVYSDTLIKVRVIFPELPEKHLNTLSSLWTRVPFYKDEGKEFKIGKSRIDQLLLYNAKDCTTNYEVDEALEEDLVALQEKYNVPLVSYFYDYQMRKSDFYLKMENNGFLVDVDRQKELKKIYTEMKNEVHGKFVALVGDEVNVKSYPQVYNLLYNIMKFRKMKRDPTSEDTIVRLLGSHAKTKEKKDTLILLLEERRIRDQLSRQINFSPDYDGRCKCSYNVIATETVRSSTSILKKPMRPRKMGLAYHTISKHGKLGKDIRSMLVVDPGMVMLAADGSQCQARIVAVLCEDWELLNAFDTVDIHRRTAGLIFGYLQKLELSADFKHPIVDYLSKDGPERFTGKKVRHAGNFDMGKGRYMIEFNTAAQKYGIDMSISEWKAGHDLELFHAASPLIRNKYHVDVKDAINNGRVLIDPFGGIRMFTGRMDNELYKEGYADIPQRTEAHVVQGAALKIEDELNDDIEHMWLAENHDSICMQVPANNWHPYARLMKKHMETPIDFRTYCSLKRDYTLTIPCDVEMSTTNYGDFEKVKF